MVKMAGRSGTLTHLGRRDPQRGELIGLASFSHDFWGGKAGYGGLQRVIQTANKLIMGLNPSGKGKIRGENGTFVPQISTDSMLAIQSETRLGFRPSFLRHWGYKDKQGLVSESQNEPSSISGRGCCSLGKSLFQGLPRLVSAGHVALALGDTFHLNDF